MKALVVDDSGITRRILVDTLQSIGFTEVLEAADGKSAIESLVPGLDIILTDWNMPGMAGIELIRTLRQNPDYANIPTLMIMSRNVKSDVVEASQAGISSYLMKPFTREMLREKISELLPNGGTATGTNG